MLNMLNVPNFSNVFAKFFIFCWLFLPDLFKYTIQGGPKVSSYQPKESSHAAEITNCLYMVLGQAPETLAVLEHPLLG